MISMFEIYKIGIGPSSSHTFGPMKAAKMFIDQLIEQQLFDEVDRIEVDLYGSLASTGKGHHTDLAVTLGLAGNLPATVDIESIPQFLADNNKSGKLLVLNKRLIQFSQQDSIHYHIASLSLHENALNFTAYQREQLLLSKTYYSIGGGTVVDDAYFTQQPTQPVVAVTVPYPFESAQQLLAMCRENNLKIAELVYQNELCYHSAAEISDYFSEIWRAMQDCMQRGMTQDGVLPGVLKVPRRAPSLYRHLMNQTMQVNDSLDQIDWVNMFAMAVNEENAAGGRVVTAPTNGACGIVPSILAYYNKFIEPLTPDLLLRYFMTSAGICYLYKRNASISGAEVGCQGEVGVACSMAAAGLTELQGGNIEQITIAAEIGMEHHLGLTCDPVAGQVQVPCIERNAIASITAINAARMALMRDSSPIVSLDKVIEVMYETGRDMNAKYRETSRGGLAIKVVPCN